MAGNFTAYDIADALPDYIPQVKYPRTRAYQPGGSENRYWACRDGFMPRLAFR
jgi:amidase